MIAMDVSYDGDTLLVGGLPVRQFSREIDDICVRGDLIFVIINGFYLNPEPNNYEEMPENLFCIDKKGKIVWQLDDTKYPGPPISHFEARPNGDLTVARGRMVFKVSETSFELEHVGWTN